MPDDIIIKTNGLTKRFGSPSKGILAIDDLNIEVQRSNIFGFLGPNASGKTTTIGMLLGLIKPTSGSIELFGQDTKQDLPSLLRRTSSVLENSPFYPYLSGRNNLEVFARTMGGVKPERINKVLTTVGLKKRSKNKVKTYSLGMRQRLCIAMALLSDPELLILDEPTNGLDPEGIIEIRELIRSLGEEGKTIFLSSHLLHEVEQVCDHVAILNKGKVIAHGPVKELLRRSRMLRMRVSDTDAAVSMLMDIEWIKTIETDEDKVLFIEAPEDKYPDINERLVKKGIRVSEMTITEDTLEDFFLEVIDEGKGSSETKNA
jgi:ABC-2 type transport system ATP-binding protein